MKDHRKQLNKYAEKIEKMQTKQKVAEQAVSLLEKFDAGNDGIYVNVLERPVLNHLTAMLLHDRLATIKEK